MRSDLEYVPVTTKLTTKAAVLEAFGEPVRKVREGDLDTWYYLFTRRGVSGPPPPTEVVNGVFLVIVPLSWRSTPDDNTKFTFRNDDLVSVFELREKRGGFLCGFVGAHGVSFVCE